MVELTDISISFKRTLGERRVSLSKLNGRFVKSELWTKPKSFNPVREILNHRKHSGLLFRKASGEFEIKGKPRYHPDSFEY